MNNLTQPIVPLNFTGIEVQNLASKFVLDIRPQSPLSGRTVSKRGTYLKFKKNWLSHDDWPVIPKSGTVRTRTTHL